MSDIKPPDFEQLYKSFSSPITILDCGSKCAPHNENGVPFCCDIHHAVPTAYIEEWNYLQRCTDLWHVWQPSEDVEKTSLQTETPDDMLLLECLGHNHCQREYRSITCRAFPFFPYLNQHGEFLGISYYWEYRQRCWVINNLRVVTAEYKAQFFSTYETIFQRYPQEKENFLYHSTETRRFYTAMRRRIPLLARDGNTFLISPKTEKLNLTNIRDLPKFGVYKITALLSFPDEDGILLVK